MKNSKFEDEIQKRLDDPNWNVYISEKVKGNYNSDKPYWFSQSNLQKAATILLVSSLGLAIYFQYSKSATLFKIDVTHKYSKFSPLTNVDIKEMDLLLDNDEFNSEYLLTGFIEINE
ncbi:MAG: hypothetical protein MH321_14205 [Leptospiraceae bacterium]|nr:hypothetical protein [Leptospiraceae bacterium]